MRKMIKTKKGGVRAVSDLFLFLCACSDVHLRVFCGVASTADRTNVLNSLTYLNYKLSYMPKENGFVPDSGDYGPAATETGWHYAVGQ
ncbi:MAG: hypothetical protein LIQ31_09990 [Planctomycetes bacterium]|nr:hypothetical protein [Planctomycetota bacterium]